MKELFRIIEEPRRCSYLPYKSAALEMRLVTDMSAQEYAHLLAHGFRRFGDQIFRPACPACSDCRSLRILAQQYSFSGSERRIWRKNEHVRAELHPLFVARETVALYNRYQQFMHEHRGWALQTASASVYRDMFLSGASHLGRQWLYFDGAKLVGVAMMDEAPDAVSLVYFFYDPDWRSQSPGTFSILNQIHYAQTQGLSYAYLGYWVEACQSLAYKSRFKPYEMLVEYVSEEDHPVWKLCV